MSKKKDVEKIIEVEADSLQAFMSEELKRRIQYMESQNDLGVEPEVTKISKIQLVVPFIFTVLTLILYYIVQFTMY